MSLVLLDASSVLLDPDAIARRARLAMLLELRTWPKPGLVSHRDQGAHHDMDARLFRRSAAAIAPFFARLAAAGGQGASMRRLREIGLEAEAAMMAATGGVNTHRGAIFGLGLLAAAAGLRSADPARRGMPLGEIVRRRWGPAILRDPAPLRSHGGAALRRYGAGGARLQAASGFPAVYGLALPALRKARAIAPGDPHAVRVQACFALIAGVDDTNLLHRGGAEGLAYARHVARAFLAEGGVAHPDWPARAAGIHAEFVARRLSPGGSADLLAMALFVEEMEAAG